MNLRSSGQGGDGDESALLTLIEVCRNVCDMVVQNIIRFPSVLRALIQSVYSEVRNSTVFENRDSLHITLSSS